jgi:hypothetical protein
MRAVECPCGEHLEARNDTDLMQAAKHHSDEVHQGEYSDADLRILVDTAAYDAGRESVSQ